MAGTVTGLSGTAARAEAADTLSPAAPPDHSTARVAAWEVVLDRIELDVMRGERNLKRGLEFRTDPWDPPEQDLGPVPPALHSRAVDIHRRQVALLEKMSEQMHHTVRHQAVVEAVEAAPATAPVYVDVSV